MRLVEVAAVAAVTVGCMFALAFYVGTCVDVPEWHEKGYGFTFHCTGGEQEFSRLTHQNRTGGWNCQGFETSQ